MSTADYFDDIELPADDKLGKIAALVSVLQYQQSELERLNEEAKALSAKIKITEEVDLPAAMIDAQTTSFTTTDDVTIALVTEIYAGIKAENQPEAFAWLRKNDYDDIIKRQVTCEFGKGEERFATRLIGYLKRWHGERKRNDKLSVHSGTLGAFVREYLKREEVAAETPDADPITPIPRDLFGVYTLRKAVIQIAKKKRKL